MNNECKSHDAFNIIYIVLLLKYLLLYFVDYNVTLYRIICISKIVYCIIDIIWLYLIPSAILINTNIIFIHHILTMILVWISYINSNLFFMITPIGLLVEINTLLGILKRYINCDTLFKISWIFFRLIMFPILNYYFIKLSAGLPFIQKIISIFFSVVFTVLIFVYSYIKRHYLFSITG